jgi:adenosine deaminase
MFGTSLLGEYLALSEHQGFDLAEIRRLVENAIDSTWADEATKARLRSDLSEWSARVTIDG